MSSKLLSRAVQARSMAKALDASSRRRILGGACNLVKGCKVWP